nr:ribosomal protein L24 [Cavernulicola chilensis]
MHIKKGDIVKVIAGRDKNQIGTIINIFPKTSKLIVKGVNSKSKHIKPKKEGEKGKIEQHEFPIHSSNVMLYDNDTATISRFRYVLNNDGKKTRKLIKNNKFLD